MDIESPLPTECLCSSGDQDSCATLSTTVPETMALQLVQEKQMPWNLPAAGEDAGNQRPAPHPIRELAAWEARAALSLCLYLD